MAAPELLLTDEIGRNRDGSGIDANEFCSQLDGMAGAPEITVRVNSPGGSVFDGMQIFNALSRSKSRIVMSVEGIAASAASFILMAGDTITANESAVMMIHQAHGIAAGNATDLRETASVLDKLDQQIAGIYASRTSTPKALWLGRMKDETWLTAQEALGAKLVDSVLPNKTAAKRFAASILNRYSKRPDRVAAYARGSADPVLADRDRVDRSTVLRARLAVEQDPIQQRLLQIDLMEMR